MSATQRGVPRAVVAVLVFLMVVASSVPAVASDPGAETDSLEWLGTEGVKHPPVGPPPPMPEEPFGYVHELGPLPAEPPSGGGSTPPNDKQEQGDYQYVFPPDERTRVTPTYDFPASAVVFLELYDSLMFELGQCSGTFIGPDVILTAAHCLWDPIWGGWIGNARVVPGKDGWSEPHGYEYASWAWVPSGWRNSLGTDPDWDWGLLKLPTRALGNRVGWFQIGVLSTASLRDPQFYPTIAGYPADKPYGTMWLSFKQAFLGVEPFLLYHDIDVYDGQSGAAVWRRSDGVIVGVLIAEAPGRFNVASRIDREFLERLLNACGQLGCSISYFVESAGGSGGGGGGGNGIKPVFDSLTPGPFSVVAPGQITIGASAHSDSAVVSMTMLIGDREFNSNTNTVSAQVDLPPGVYSVAAQAIDADGDAFRAMWDIIVSTDPGEGQWFTANGTPKAEQINATMRSLVEAFRWHLYGQSWDGAPHPDLPSHASFAGTATPPGPWVQGTQFDRAATEATLRSLVEAFRWHFWGISWDGGPHCDLPTHVNCQAPQGQQGVSPWFDANGAPIPGAIEATLRSLVEAFRWHFWEFSWDGGHHPDLPTHGA
ncbi:trypsin-like serine peptidase [Sphaerobacter thermophilus]|uniref:Serine protease n=1 Tax=Sphaerobacter thermophilus (strain ATCC 49802 / DSM 20745 / KCCM 41009 / NCIMB 13125 / S 6022) TaxID=479434 RepID=D1CAC5_SPHTD|nr:trypsin-like serine protease [Sphaerobacter thermophilus]ACZ40768.1 V8-like protein Glu-specific endopeptidase-like protein [Sphaerobacter thermophilus DSM 20745]